MNNNREKLGRYVTVGGVTLSALACGIALSAGVSNLGINFSSQIVLFIVGAILGGSAGIMLFGMYGQSFVDAFFGDVKSILLIAISVISSLVASRLVWEGSSGNLSIAILGAFAGFFIPGIVIGSIVSAIKSFRN